MSVGHLSSRLPQPSRRGRLFSGECLIFFFSFFSGAGQFPFFFCPAKPQCAREPCVMMPVPSEVTAQPPGVGVSCRSFRSVRKRFPEMKERTDISSELGDVRGAHLIRAKLTALPLVLIRIICLLGRRPCCCFSILFLFFFLTTSLRCTVWSLEKFHNVRSHIQSIDLHS